MANYYGFRFQLDQLENSSTEVGSGSLQLTIFKFHEFVTNHLKHQGRPLFGHPQRELFLEFLEPPAKWFSENHGTSRKNTFHVKKKHQRQHYLIFNFPNGRMTKKKDISYICIYINIIYMYGVLSQIPPECQDYLTNISSYTIC